MKQVLVLVVLFISSCGGGGGGGGGSSWTGPLTPKGYPAVSGNYRIDYSPVSGACSDGSKVNLDGSSQLANVSQAESAISVVSLTRIISDVSDTPASGDIDKNGAFSLHRHRVINLNGTPAQLDYHYTGQAFPNGLAGDVAAHISIPQGDCDVNGTFSGNKVS